MGDDLSINKVKRKSIRLRGYDYASTGVYFVTICTDYRKSMLGSIKNSKIILYTIGKKVCEFWNDIPNHFQNVHLDIYIIMPNHIHGLIHVLSPENVGAEHVQPHNQYQHIIKGSIGSIGSIIRQFKASVTRWCNQNGYEYFSWQRNYYEHIVRNEDECNRIREYIITNPLKWKFDRDNMDSDNFNMDLDKYYKDIYKK